MLADEMPDIGYILTNDTGCRYSPSCLACPLPQCIHDAPNTVRQTKRRARDAERLEIMAAENLTVVQAVARFGISERTVWRILARDGN